MKAIKFLKDYGYMFYLSIIICFYVEPFSIDSFVITIPTLLLVVYRDHGRNEDEIVYRVIKIEILKNS